MNLGQFLTDNSPLSSGTVAEHLAAIAANVGTGSGQTIYCSQIAVRIQRQETVISHRPKRQAAPARPAAPAASGSKPARQKQNLYATAPRHTDISIFSAPHEITATLRTDSVVVLQSLESLATTKGSKS